MESIYTHFCEDKENEIPLTFIVEKLNNDNYEFWTQVANFEEEAWNKEIDAPEFFRRSILFRGIEVYIGYIVSGKNITKETRQCLEYDDIEMLVSITTFDDTPIVTHMGIFTTYCFAKEEEYKKRRHPRSSARLHSYCATVMQKILTKPIDYMITYPTPIMRNIIVKSLPKEYVFIGYIDQQIYALAPSKMRSSFKPIELTEQEYQKRIEEYRQIYFPYGGVEIDSPLHSLTKKYIKLKLKNGSIYEYHSEFFEAIKYDIWKVPPIIVDMSALAQSYKWTF